MLMGTAWKRLRAALGQDRRILLWLVATYIPAVFAAGYLSSWFLHTYLLAFIAGGAYMLALGAVWIHILVAVWRGSSHAPDSK